MKYSEMIDFCLTNNVCPTQFMCAEEIDFQLKCVNQIEVTPERFEILCEIARITYLKAEGISLTRICKAIARLEEQYMHENGKNPEKMSKWDILNEAACEED